MFTWFKTLKAVFTSNCVYYYPYYIMFFYFFISTYHLVSLFFSSYAFSHALWLGGVLGGGGPGTSMGNNGPSAQSHVHHSERERDKDWETFIVVHHHDALYNVKPWVICNLTTLWHSECNQQSLMGANQRHLSAVCKQTHTHFTCHSNEPESEASAINGHKYWAGDLKKKKKPLVLAGESNYRCIYSSTVLHFVVLIPC